MAFTLLSRTPLLWALAAALPASLADAPARADTPPATRPARDVPERDPQGLTNLALLPAARAGASSVYAGGRMAIHQVEHLNDGRYGNEHSWISAGEPSWCEIDLGETCRAGGVALGSEHTPRYRDRAATRFEVLVTTEPGGSSGPGSGPESSWTRAFRYQGLPLRTTRHFHFDPVPARRVRIAIHAGVDGEVRIDELEVYGLPAAAADRPFPERLPTEVLELRAELSREVTETRESRESAGEGPAPAALRELARSLEEVAARGKDPAAFREALASLRAARCALALERLPRDLQELVFVKRHAYHPSHIYTEYADAPYRPGGGLYLLARTGEVRRLLDARDGICRDPDVSFDGRRILFSWRRGEADTYHIFEIAALDGGGSGLRQLTRGPFHDLYPTYLPDGRIAFISTRCRSRVLCFTTESATLHVMEADGSNITALSANNVNEYTPSLLPDGRLLFTRWEYMDKGADHSQSLWAVLPDGTGLTHLFGNDISRPYSYLSARAVPGTGEIVATLASHWGDHIGPVGRIDPALGPKNPQALENLTPEYPVGTYRGYRDPYPLAAGCLLVAYGPGDHYRICLLEPGAPPLGLHEDPEISCFQPVPLRARPRPPVLAPAVERPAPEATLVVVDVYRGLEGAVPRGAVKYLRVVEEVRHELPALPEGGYRTRFEPLKYHYASPTDEVKGPFGWPTYMAKAIHGTVRVEPDGSAHFRVPAERPIYFQALDAELNEIQRMRSIAYFRPGETRTCIGCHERSHTAPPAGVQPLASRRPPDRPRPPAFGGGPFSYRSVVQPVLDRRCVSCHGGTGDAEPPDLTWLPAAGGVPASYRELLAGGFVHIANTHWNATNELLAPLSFGTAASRLVHILDAGHQGVRLGAEERERITTWIDLNCPLWGDYDPESRPLAP